MLHLNSGTNGGTITGRTGLCHFHKIIFVTEVLSTGLSRPEVTNRIPLGSCPSPRGGRGHVDKPNCNI